MSGGSALRRIGLGAYLAGAFSLLSVVLTVVLTLVIERTATAQLESSIGNNLAELAHQATNRLDRGMFERYREGELLTRRLERMALADLADARSELDDLRASYRHYAWVGLTDTEGRVRAASGGLLEGVNVAQRPWFAGGLAGAFMGDVHDAVLLARLLGRGDGAEPLRFFDVAFPVRDTTTGRPRGVLGIHVSWDWAQDLRRAVFVSVGGESTVEPLIVSRGGMVLLGPRGTEGQKLAVPSLARAAGGPGHTVESWPDGKSYLVGYSPSVGHERAPSLGWTVLVRQDLTEAYAPVRQLQRNVVLWGGALALLFSLLGWWAARAITRPVLALADSARALEAGQAAVVPESDAYAEARTLGTALNSLVSNLRGQEARLRDLNASLERRVEDRTVELRETFERVRTNEQRIRTIIEAAPDPFIGMDTHGRLIDWNTQAEATFGWRRDEVLGRPLADTLLPERFRAAFTTAMARFHATGDLPPMLRSIERILIDRAGREIECEVRIALIDAAPERFFAAFVHDITHRKEVERLKNEFVSTVSHELRTPLTSIYGSLDLLYTGMAGELPPDVRQLLAISHQSTQRLIRLINDVLDVEKIASGRMEYRIGPQSLRALLQQAVRDTQGYADSLGVVLALADGADAEVQADADRIVQVCVNLLSNAIKFSPAGAAVEIKLDVGPEWARVGVVDRGPGLPPEFHARLFERFAQADASDRRTQGGTGLGLNICRSIVEAHGGRIGFTSEPGVRTEFHFELRRG